MRVQGLGIRVYYHYLRVGGVILAITFLRRLRNSSTLSNGKFMWA